jgi:hypothetical protein
VQPIVLRYSLRSWSGFWLFFFVFAAAYGWYTGAWSRWVFTGGLVLGVLFVSNVELDAEYVTLAPVFHLMPRRRVKLDRLGPFEPLTGAGWALTTFRSGISGVRAEIVTGPPVWLWFRPAQWLYFTTTLGLAHLAPPLTREQLLDVLETYRQAAISRPRW